MTNNIIKEGYLQKQTHSYGNYHHPFEKRWVVLEHKSLICYSTSNKKDITHPIDISIITDVIKTKKKHTKIFQFELIRKGYIDNIKFIANDKLQMTEWIKSIKYAANLTPFSTYKHPKSAHITKEEENKHLKKENKLLHKTVNKLKQKIRKLKSEINRLTNHNENDNYNILITEELKINNNDEIDRKSNIQNISKYLRRKKSSKKKHNKISKLLKSPSTSKKTSPASSDNEFESDHISLSGDATNVNNYIVNNICDIFNRLKNINESKLIKMLMNEIILFDSKMKVFSTSNNTYIDTAGILTKNNLYLISAINYEIWMEFEMRTKIDDIIPDENNNDLKIDKKMSNELIMNLNIIDDYKINQCIKKHFIGKTKKEIKLNILLNDIPIKSLCNLFIDLHEICNNEVLRFQKLKDVNVVIIKDFYNTQIIKTYERDKVLETIFKDIPWIEQQKMNDSIVITFRDYFAKSIVLLLNDRKNKYFNNNNNKLEIEEYNNKTKYTQYSTTVADIKNFNKLQLIGNVNDIGYGFILMNKILNMNNIKCLLETNNLCQEWLAHLDYALFGDKILKGLSERTESNSDMSESDSSKSKLMNDFTNEDAYFGFGIYLNYWENGFENTVTPKYCTLKKELLNNKICVISEREYYWLYEECMKLYKTKRHKVTAKHIGVNNKKFNIESGTPITMNHLISLKLYTDFCEITKKFKKTMRKKNHLESLESLICRNSECAQWSRYIKESCSFYGGNLGKNITLYTGLTRKLLFSSMRQHFECPLSTTLNYNKALTFCKDNGCVLKLKAGNSKTRYFDVSWLSRYKEEQERLIMGSSLKICDIYVNSKSAKQYIAAFLMFEQLINGQFIDRNNYKQKENILYLLIAYIMKLNIINININININISTHIIDLFEHMIKEMLQKYVTNELYINRDEMNKIEHNELKQLFNGLFWDYFKIDQLKLNWIQEYIWNICDDIYTEFKKMGPRKYILSKKFECKYKSEKIQFYLKCCAKYSEDSQKCALFLQIDKLKKNIKSVKIEYDLLCKTAENKVYRNLILPQMLSNDKLYCGSILWRIALHKTTSITWRIGLKIIDVTYY